VMQEGERDSVDEIGALARGLVRGGRSFASSVRSSRFVRPWSY
jgi:hypothetical protein